MSEFHFSNLKKVLGVFSLVMINVIAVDSLRSLPFSAEYGFSLVFYYLFAAVMFFIPISLVSAELATGWPNKGGIYVWVREAFGDMWGFVIIWFQWVYNIVWYPTILSFIAGTIAFLVKPELAESKVFILLTVMVIFWGATLLNCFGMKLSSLVSTLGAIFGTLFPMLLIITLGALWIGMGKPIQIEFTLQHFMPNLSDTKSLAFLTALLFGLVGMEMSAVHADEVRDPGKAFPKAILYSTIIILASLILSSLAIALVVPRNDLSVVTGLVQAFAIFFSAFNMKWMSPIITLLIIIGGIGGVAAWIIGPTKGLLVAVLDGNAPKFLAKMTKKQVPVNILILQAVIFTVLCSVFLLMPTVSSSYWLLTAMTAQLAMIVYLGLFAAAIYLRFKYPDVHRPFKIPFGKPGMLVVCGVGIFSCLIAIGLGFIPPSQISVGSTLVYESLLIGGGLLLSLPPVYFYYFGNSRK